MLLLGLDWFSRTLNSLALTKHHAVRTKCLREQQNFILIIITIIIIIMMMIIIIIMITSI